MKGYYSLCNSCDVFDDNPRNDGYEYGLELTDEEENIITLLWFKTIYKRKKYIEELESMGYLEFGI